MITYQTIRLRGLRKSTILSSWLTESTKKATKDADSEYDLDDADAEDGTALTANEQQVLVSPLPHVFGRAICDEAHYMKNVDSRTAYAIKILRVQSIAFLMDQTIVNFSPELVWLASFFGRPTNGKDGRAESRTIARFRECLDVSPPLADRCLYPESLCLSKGLGSSEVCAMALEAWDDATDVAGQDAADVAGCPDKDGRVGGFWAL